MNIGTNISEREAQGSSIISSAPLYNIGIFGKSPKGVTGKAVLVTSLDSFTTAFGGADANYYSYYMLKGLFNNVGVTLKPNVYFVREYDTANPGVSSSLTIGSGLDYFKISAGYFGANSPGIWGDNIRLQFVAGSSVSSFYLNIYELRLGILYLVESTSEFEVSEMESVINTYSKWIKCEAFGDISAITITSDVPNYKVWTAAPLFSPYTAVLDGITGEITSLTGYATLILELTVGATVVSVSMTESDLLALVDPSDLVDVSGVLKLPVSVVSQKFISYINASATVANPVTAEYISFTGLISITTLSPGVSLNSVVNPLGTSFTIVDTTSGITLSTGYQSLTGGSNPGEPNTSQVMSVHAKFLEGKNLQYAMSCDRFDLGWAQALESWSESQSLLGIFQADKTEVPSGDFSAYATLLKPSSFLAGYFNWGYVDKESTSGEILVPTIASIFGAYYVKRKVNFGGYSHIAPGGVDVSVQGFKRLQWGDDLTPNLVTIIARTFGFNTLKFSPGYGFVVESSRTMSTRSKYYSIHIRVAKNFIIQSMKTQMKLFQQRPNSPIVRSSLASTARIFLGKRYSEGMFEVEGGFENNIGIQCNEENNDISIRKNRKLALDMSLNFAEIAEEVNISMVQVETGLKITEA